MLREQYPDVQFEVVNGAMTAINSHVVLEIARDCAKREPDLFVVYMGNNEVVGPYGPGTVFQQWSRSLRMIRTSLWVKSTRVGQLLGNVVGHFRSDEDTPGHWRGMEMFLDNPVAADDPRMTTVYDNYRRNLTDICGIARGARAGVVLSTVAVNLRDCPPFASLHRSDLASEDLAKWESIYEAGGELETGNRWPEALERYEAAAKIDDRFAELQYHIGLCLMKAGRVAEASERFALARDLDVLRFRADSRVNAIVREVAGEQQAGGVRFVDAQRTLAQIDPDSEDISEGDLFYEHVHLTFAGNYRLARAVFDQVREALPQLAALDQHGAVPSPERCAELLALTPWDEHQLAAAMVDMTARPPFTNQFSHSIRQAEARRRRDDLRERASTPEAMQAAWKTYEAALAKAPDDWSMHYHFGMLAMQRRRPDVAVEHFQIVVEKLPWDAGMRSELGNALARQGRVDEAIAQLQQALEIDPGLAEAHNNLGIALADRGQVDEAIAHYQKALEIEPGLAAAHYNLGNVMAGRKEVDEAIAHYEQALEIKPDYAEPHNNLGSVLLGRRQVDEAVAHFQKALEIKPDYAKAHNNLGIVLASRGDADEAAAHFQQALEIEPDNVDARRNLELLRSKRKEP
jgi:tetratricopeptide (TPR) repeat protein